MVARIPATDIADMDAVVAGNGRLTVEQVMRLYYDASIYDLGRWATRMANRIHGDQYRTYIIDRNVNYTNVCSAKCTFCAFRRNGDEHDAYVLEKQELHDKIRELSDIGGTQVLLQGGMHPDLPIEFYEDMLSSIRDAFPQIDIHGFSPPEFVEFVAVCEIDGFPTTKPGSSGTLERDVWTAKLEAVMRRLQAAGLASLPGGGGEIFIPAVRQRIGRGKATGEQWLDVMKAAHRLGMRTSGTMMFGHIEGIADRFNHMNMIRDAQDEAINNEWPGRYMAFISWPFQPDNTPLGRLKQWDAETDEAFPGDILAKGTPHDDAGKRLRLAGATEYLRMQALSRLFMDNIQSIGSSWVTMGPKIGQLGLLYGANDMGSVMMEENVVSSAGTTYCLNEASICRLIRDAGYTPAQRGNAYDILKIHDGDDSPDAQVDDWAQLRPAMTTPGEMVTGESTEEDMASITAMA